VPELAAAAPEIEHQRELPGGRSSRRWSSAASSRMLLRRSLGGAELLRALYVWVVEEIAKRDAS
jgi:hypothetical protein